MPVITMHISVLKNNHNFIFFIENINFKPQSITLPVISKNLRSLIDISWPENTATHKITPFKMELNLGIVHNVATDEV